LPKFDFQFVSHTFYGYHTFIVSPLYDKYPRHNARWRDRHGTRSIKRSSGVARARTDGAGHVPRFTKPHRNVHPSNLRHMARYFQSRRAEPSRTCLSIAFKPNRPTGRPVLDQMHQRQSPPPHAATNERNATTRCASRRWLAGLTPYVLSSLRVVQPTIEPWLVTPHATLRSTYTRRIASFLSFEPKEISRISAKKRKYPVDAKQIHACADADAVHARAAAKDYLCVAMSFFTCIYIQIGAGVQTLARYIQFWPPLHT
jgi:hypothetical protein